VQAVQLAAEQAAVVAVAAAVAAAAAEAKVQFDAAALAARRSAVGGDQRA